MLGITTAAAASYTDGQTIGDFKRWCNEGKAEVWKTSMFS